MVRPYLKTGGRKYKGSIVQSGNVGSSCGPSYARGVDPAGQGGVETMSRCYSQPDDPPPTSSKEPITKYKLFPKSPKVGYDPPQAPPQAAYDPPEMPPEPVSGCDPCDMQHGRLRHDCPDVKRCDSPMPYPDFSFRGIRGRTFGNTDEKKNCAEHHKDSPNCHSIKNAHDMEEYAAKTCTMLEVYGAPPWVHQKISEIRQQVGDVKHYLQHEYGRGYGHGARAEHDWSKHGEDPNWMAHQNLHTVAEYSHYICTILKGLDSKIPPWAADKLAKARTNTAEIYHYLDYHIYAHEMGFAKPSPSAALGVPALSRSRKKYKRMGRPSIRGAHRGVRQGI